jgi:obg-like ATPase 1
VEGDVDPLRDMEIIQNELRLKDIEWVQKQLDGLKKTGRSLGSNSLADKARKEEIVSASLRIERLGDHNVFRPPSRKYSSV